MSAGYDKIGQTYSRGRGTDPRIAAQIHQALGDAEKVLNVGAGTGSYEPDGRDVMAVEPSAEMIRQRPEGAAPVIQGSAEDLPFDAGSFDAAMGILTIHHWGDQAKGLAEMRRVTTGPIVLLTYDPTFRDFWLLDYFPELAALDEGQMPPLAAYRDWLGKVEITPVPIPWDCADGFLSAYWQRPEAYLDPEVRAGMSSFWKIGGIEEGLTTLRRDLDSGAWQAKHRALMDQDARDMGYRLVVSRS